MPLRVGPMTCSGCRRLVIYYGGQLYDYIPRAQRIVGGWFRSQNPHDCPALSPKEREAMAAAKAVLGGTSSRRLARVMDGAA